MRRTLLIITAACMAGLVLSHPAQCETADRTFENASIAFVHTYMQQWSSSNPEALAYMDKVFPDEAAYFNQTLNHAALMRAKRRFAERWPLRHFAVRNDGLSVSCDERHLCTVWGLVDWHCRSPERQADALGTSVFAFRIQDGQTMVDEDGFVIARGQILSRDLAAVPDGSKTFSNADIPGLRKAFYDDSADRNWITTWLAARHVFSGTARSLGQAGARDLTASDGSGMPYAVFQSDQGPIACMMIDPQAVPPPGEAVRLQGTVAIFIDRTMYLSHCSFG